MAIDYFTNAVRYLDQIGVTDIIIPFLLIFTVVFVALQKGKVFGKNPKDTQRYSLVVALALALGVVISHVTRNFTYTRGVDAVTIINNAIPRVSVVLIAALFFLIMIGVFGFENPDGGSKFSGFIALLAILIIGYIFMTASGLIGYNGSFLYRLGPDVTALIVVLLVFGAIVYFITSPPKETSNTDDSWFGKMLKGFSKPPSE